MDLGFLTEMFGGKGTNPMAMLLPLLIGGKSPDLSSLMGLFSKANNKDALQNSDQSADFPPLFGTNAPYGDRNKGDILQLLGKMLPPKTMDKQVQKDNEEYPYELQYNRPFKG